MINVVNFNCSESVVSFNEPVHHTTARSQKEMQLASNDHNWNIQTVYTSNASYIFNIDISVRYRYTE